MTLRTKTVEYAFPTNTAQIAAGTRYEFPEITLYIPENSSRTFLSVAVELAYRDNSATALSGANPIVGIKLGAASFDNVTVTDTITNSGEQQTGLRIRDVTSYFNTNFGAGTSQTCQASWQIGTLPTINVGVKLIITYQFDDAGQTIRIKTVKIPIESPIAVLTATLAEIGTNQVPKLTGVGGFLPESGITIRDIFFEIYFNESATAITDFNFCVALDAESEVQFGIFEQALNSSVFDVLLWKRTDMAPDSAHAFKARSTVASRCCWLAMVLHVTYEYNHDDSSTILNSIAFAVGDLTGYIGGTTAVNCTRMKRVLWIEEPSPITLKQSGILLGINANAVSNINIKCGVQNYRTYTHQLGTTQCGCYILLHRIDSGAAQGVGISISRGENLLDLSMYGATASRLDNITGMCYLNYTSGKAPTGADSHNHTIRFIILPTVPDAIEHETSAIAPTIPEPNYRVIGVAYLAYTMFTYLRSAISLKAHIGDNEGWEPIYESHYQSSATELSLSRVCIMGKDMYKRYPQDPDTSRLDIETARKYRFTAGIANWTSIILSLTYHAITYTVSGTVSGYDGDGSGILVEIHRTDTDEKVLSGTTAVGGTYSLTWYDNVITLYAHVRQDATHVGRSDDGLAT